MKKVIALVLALSFALTVPAFAQMKDIKGPSAQALAKASDDSVVDKVGDWFATRGKSDQEKQAILMQRRGARTAEKAQKQAEKKAREMKKQADKAGKDMGQAFKMPKK
jgi:regulator of protease activity HflC (stomatin/prohibitin superfamily)